MDNSQIIENLRLIYACENFGDQRKGEQILNYLVRHFLFRKLFRLSFSCACVFWVFESIREMIQLWHFEWIRDDPHRPTMRVITHLMGFLVRSRTLSRKLNFWTLKVTNLAVFETVFSLTTRKGKTRVTENLKQRSNPSPPTFNRFGCQTCFGRKSTYHCHNWWLFRCFSLI